MAKQGLEVHPLVAAAIPIARNIGLAGTAWAMPENPMASLVVGGTAVGLTLGLNKVTDTYYKDFSTITCVMAFGVALGLRLLVDNQHIPADYFVKCAVGIACMLTVTESVMNMAEVSVRD